MNEIAKMSPEAGVCLVILCLIFLWGLVWIPICLIVGLFLGYIPSWMIFTISDPDDRFHR